jgi:ATP-binding cassette, subfamily B, bacterial
VRVTGDILADLFRHLTGHALSYFAKRMPGVLTSCHVEHSLHDRKHVRVECRPLSLATIGAIAYLAIVNVWMAGLQSRAA